MHCRVVFSGIKSFANLRQFHDHVKSLASAPSGKFDASFFLFRKPGGFLLENLFRFSIP